MHEHPDAIAHEVSSMTVLRLIDETRERLAVIRDRADDLLRKTREEPERAADRRPV